MTPIVNFDDLDDDLDAEAKRARARAGRLAVVVSDAQRDVAQAFPELSALRSETLADMVASHRYERAQAQEDGWPSARVWFQSASHLYAVLAALEHES